MFFFRLINKIPNFNFVWEIYFVNTIISDCLLNLRIWITAWWSSPNLSWFTWQCLNNVEEWPVYFWEQYILFIQLIEGWKVDIPIITLCLLFKENRRETQFATSAMTLILMIF